MCSLRGENDKLQIKAYKVAYMHIASPPRLFHSLEVYFTASFLPDS